MSQFSLWDDVMTKQIEPTTEILFFDDARLMNNTPIRYRNGSYIIKGKILDGKHDGKYQQYQVQADMDKPGEFYGYSIQWIYEFQIQ